MHEHLAAILTHRDFLQLQHVALQVELQWQLPVRVSATRTGFEDCRAVLDGKSTTYTHIVSAAPQCVQPVGNTLPIEVAYGRCHRLYLRQVRPFRELVTVPSVGVGRQTPLVVTTGPQSAPH